MRAAGVDGKLRERQAVIAAESQQAEAEISGPATDRMQGDGRPHPYRHSRTTVEVSSTTKTKWASTMKITTVGINLAKKVFQVYGINDAWQGGVEEAVAARPDGRVLRQPAALSDRHGGLRQRAPLGSQAAEHEPQGAADGSAVRQAVQHRLANSGVKSGFCSAATAIAWGSL